jgi:hypothetical protein
VVAAGILLVTSVGILQYRQRPQQNAAVVSSPGRLEEKIVTALQSPQPSASTPAVRAITPQAPAKQNPAHNLSRALRADAADHPVWSPKAISPAPQPMNRAGAVGGIGSGIGSGSGEAAKNYQMQPQNDAFAFSPAAKEAAPAAPSQQVAVSGASQAVPLESETAQLESQFQEQNKLAKNQAEPPPQKQPLNNLDVVKAKDSVPPQAESSVVFAPMVNSSKVALQKGMLATPRWAISSTGALQRSFDAGQTWEDVNVAEVALAGRLKTDSTSAYQADLQDKKLQKKWKKESNAGLVFRAMAAMGAEVWVGGSGAILYYSLDSGVHWTRVLPTEAGTLLTGDVVGVELSDAEHTSVSTSTGEIWITADHGQTWHKQQ